MTEPPTPAQSAAPRTPVALAPRGNASAPLVFKRGAAAPFAVRWFGITSLFAHARSLASNLIATEQIDSRDWMRPEEPSALLARMLRVLGGDEKAATLVQGLGRPLFIDFVADTGDDHDVSAAVAAMLFREYAVTEPDGTTRVLPRGDVLVFGGDTAYPVSTVDAIHDRVVAPWNEVIERAERGLSEDELDSRVLLGIPGNHDWYDGLDGFARLFRRRAERRGVVREAPRQSVVPEGATLERRKRRGGRKTAFVVRQLHLDEVGDIVELAKNLGRSALALWGGPAIARRKRLALTGYEAVQESSFWAVPLAPGLDAFGVDRQLSRLDFRQRTYFQELRRAEPKGRVLFVAPDPAIAFGETWKPGAHMLASCHLSFDEDEIFYITGDMHHYERRVASPSSMHVIAGGGGAFLHGTRIRLGPGGEPAAVYPNAKVCRRLVAEVPLRLMLGGAGFLLHIAFGLIAALELAASLRGDVPLVATSVLMSVTLAVYFYIHAGSHRVSRSKIALVTVPFGVALGLLPMALRLALPALVPVLLGDVALLIVYAFLGAFGFGLFLTTLAILGLEHQQAYAVLAHPGFKHFVRLCVHEDGRVEGWTIGKDDPIAPGEPVLIDSFAWGGEAGGRG